jgi:periplasmic copper chaperone A
MMLAPLQVMILLLAAALPSGAAVGAQDGRDAGVVIRDAWVRESTAARTSSSGYFTIENRTDTAVGLVKVALDGAADVQVHTIVEQQGQTAMRPVSVLRVPAHGSVDLAPGGTHVMLMDLARPLKVGTTVELTLTFDNGRTRKILAVVRPLSAVSAR